MLQIVRGHGARIGLLASDSATLGNVSAALPPSCNIESPRECGDVAEHSLDTAFRVERIEAAASSWRLLHDDKSLTEGELSEVQLQLVSELHFALASHARTALFVHAGSVGWKGRAIVVPGRSMSGKTTLVQALARAGADYYSDEYAVLDERGFIHPYERPLSVRAADGSGSQLPAEALGCQIGGPPLPVGLIVKTRFEAGAKLELKPVGSARGLMTLLDNTLLVRERTSFALDRLAPAARDALTIEGPRDDADEAAQWILESVTWGR